MLKITSHPKNVERIEPFVEGLVKKYQINPDTYGNILISLTEAVTNAIVHGNQADENKIVQVRLNEMKGGIVFQVSDEGKGFNYKDVPDPTKPENLMKCGGRGVFLMHQLCDSVCFRNNGSTVEMQFKIK